MSWTIVQKNTNANLRLLCSILRVLFRRAPAFPEVARHCTTFVASLIEVLLKAEGGCSEDCLNTIQVVLKTFPGSCGVACPLIEKFILSNLKPNSTVSFKTLARIYSLMPRIGGGGKEGIHHKANYVTLFQRLSYALQDVLDEILNMSLSGKRTKSSQAVRPVPSLNLPKSPSDSNLLQKALYLQCQYEGLALCLSELMAVPFPHPKSIRPALVLSVLKKAFDTSLPQLNTSATHSHEAKILLLVSPPILVSSINILRTLIEVCGTAMLPFAPTYMEVISGIFSELRHFGSQTSVDLKVANYSLLCKVCQAWGTAAVVSNANGLNDLVAYVLSDILPKDPQLTTKPVKKDKRQSKDNSIKWSATKLWNDKLMYSALKCLTEILQSLGPLLEEAVHKQIQCALLAVIMEHETKLGQDAKYQLYKAMGVMLAHGHYKASPSLPLISHIFHKGGLDAVSDPCLQDVCRQGIQLCSQQMHPSRSSMHLDIPMDVKTVEEIKKELMKVHVFYMDNQEDPVSEPFVDSKTVIEEDEEESTEGMMETDQVEEKAEENEVALEKEKLSQVSSILKRRREQSGDAILDKEDADIPSVEESRKLNLEAYNLDEEPIFIPEGLTKLQHQKENKIPKLASSEATTDSNYLDTKTMIEDFVPVLK